MGKPWMWRSTIVSLALNLLARAMVQVACWAAMLRCEAAVLFVRPTWQILYSTSNIGSGLALARASRTGLVSQGRWVVRRYAQRIIEATVPGRPACRKLLWPRCSKVVYSSTPNPSQKLCRLVADGAVMAFS